MGKKDKRAAKKKPMAEAPTNSSNKRLIDNLKTANARLVEETTQCRQEIERLRMQLDSLVAEKDIFHGIKHDAFALVVSSSLQEYASRATSLMATTTEREKNLKKEIEVMAAEANAKDKKFSVLLEEKDQKDKELEELRNKIRSIQQANENGRRRRRKNLICCVFAAVPLIIASGAAFWRMSKK